MGLDNDWRTALAKERWALTVDPNKHTPHTPHKHKGQKTLSQEHAVEALLSRSGYTMLTLLEQMRDGFILLNEANQVVYVNPAAEKLLHLKSDELRDTTIDSLAPHFAGASLKQLLESARAKQEPILTQVWSLPLERQLEMSIQPAQEVLALYIREAKPSSPSYSEKSRPNALDPITGLPNFSAFKQELEHVLAVPVDQDMCHAVFYIDLDHFKAINDTLGYETGNEILKEMGRRLHALIHPSGSVCRLYGDKFACYLSQATFAHINETGTQLLNQLSMPMEVMQSHYIVTPSIGISLYPRDGQDVRTLLANAELAVFHLKKEGRNRFRFYTPELKRSMKRRFVLENALHQALANHQFHLAYQPLVDLQSGTIRATEALLRWTHPAIGPISPTEFLPYAEDNDLITDIGQWVLHTACRQTKQWQSQGYPHLSVSVNVSARQLQRENLPLMVEEALERSGLHPGNLHIEITESAMICKQDRALEILDRLKQLGCHIVIDDFGTHYSSLHYLKNLPADMVKLDRSFTGDLLYSAKTTEIVKSIIELGHRLHFKVVAEGVESQEQAALLQQYGCQLAQGYLFSPPLGSGELKAWLDTQSVTLP